MCVNCNSLHELHTHLGSLAFLNGVGDGLTRQETHLLSPSHDLRTFKTGFEPKDLVGTPSLDLVHPDEAAAVRKLH